MPSKKTPSRSLPQSMEERAKEMQALLDKMSTTMAESRIKMGRNIRISDDEYKALRDFIYDRSGISIPSTRKYLLENRLGPRLKDLNLESFSDYLNYLKKDPQRNKEEGRLFELVTTNETSFYRNTAQLDALEQTILPELIDKKRKAKDQKLHIWSAGCSTGEEPYTLSIILHELLQSEFPRWRITIAAHDISDAVLQAAKEGVYTEYSLRTTPESIIKKYFDKRDDRFIIKPEVRRCIKFGKINLNDDAQLRRTEPADIIFCRNVIIYFDTAMKKRLIQSFFDRLLPEGYLFIGHSESLHSLSEAFTPRYFPGAIVYKKPHGGKL